MTEIIGTITNVTEEPIGSTLAADAAQGAGEITVADGEEFNPEGGQLQIGDEQHGYTVDGDTLTLDGTLADAYEEGEPVLVHPPGAERWAWVREPGGEESLQVRVPHALWDRIPLGIREEAQGEEVECELTTDGVAVIADVVGRAPVVDGSFIEPNTVEPEAITDGEPPASSPAVTLAGGPRYLAATWEAITNHDPVTYELHLSTSSGFTPDASTLVDEIQGTAAFIFQTPAGAPLAHDTTYYARLVAKDADGATDPGAEASAQMVKIAETEITPESITTPLLATNAVTAEKILADEALFNLLQTVLLVSNTIKVPGETGQRLELDRDGMRLFALNGEQTVTLDSQTGQARFRGVVDFGSDSHLWQSDVIELAEQGEGTFETPVLVQRFGASGVGSATGTRQMDHAGTSGVVRLMAVYTQANTTHTLSDSSGELASNWELVQSVNTAAGGRLSLWVRTAATRPGRNLPNVSFGTSTGWRQVAFEYSGLALEDEDVAASASGSGTSISVGPTASTSQTDALVFGVIVSPGLAAEPSGYESLGFVLELCPYAKRVTSQGAQSIAATQAASGPWLGIVAAFKARASGNPPAPDAGKVRVFARSKRLATIDEDGLVSELVPRHAARVFRASGQNIPTGTDTETAIQFTNVSGDDGGFWNPANPDRLTIPEDGWYQVEGGFAIEQNATGWRLAQLKLGVVILDAMRVPAAGNSNPVLSVSSLGYFEAGQVVRLYATQNSGSTLTLPTSGVGIPLPYLAIARVA